MSRQVGFYMTEADEQELMRFLNSDGDVCILLYRMPSSTPDAGDALPDRNVLGWFNVWLWDRDISPQPTLEFVSQQQYYVVDGHRSEVIEFARSYIVHGGLVRGRIWAEMSYLDLRRKPPQRVEKSVWFRKWFDRVAAWIKKKGTADRFGAYVLPGAAAYAAGGGRFCSVSVAPDAKFIRH